MKRDSNIIVLLCCCLFGTFLSGQQNLKDPLPIQLREVGYPLIQNYGPATYDAFDQNWGFSQDSLGILHIANGDGVLTYNGVRWELLDMPNKGSVFSLATDAKGKIYIGAHNELGYLEIDSVGRKKYVSLLPLVPKEYKNFNIIRQIYATAQGVFFRGDRVLFKWNGEAFETWKDEEEAPISAFYVNNSLYLHNYRKGLMLWTSDSFEPIPGGELFSGERIRFMVPYDETGTLLIGTNDALYTYDGSFFNPLRTDHPDFFEGNTIYCGLRLSDGTFAIGSAQKGILILDREGRQRAMLSKEGLLNSNAVVSLYQDSSGILWAALFSGIAKIEYPSPFSVFDHDSQTLVQSIQRFDGKIYMGTTTGLFYLDSEDPNYKPEFKKVDEFPGMAWDMIVFENFLLIGSTKGTYQLDKKGKLKLLSEGPTRCLKRSIVDPNRVYLGLSPGLSSIYFEDGDWKKEKDFTEISFEVRPIIELANGNLWLKTNTSEVVRIDFDYKNDAIDLDSPNIKIYGEKDGLPGEFGVPYLIEGKFYFIENSGDSYVYDNDDDRFRLDNSLYEQLGLGSKKVKIVSQDEQGNLWIMLYKNDEKFDQLVAFKNGDGSFKLKSLGEQRIMDLRRNEFFLEPADNIVWYKGKSGIVRHDLSGQNAVSHQKPKVLITETLYKNDSLLFAAYGKAPNIEIPYFENELRFRFAGPNFHSEVNNVFKYRLLGYDSEWSDWTTETQKDYTNLSEGDYTFKVLTKNIFGDISDEDSYKFTIMPPWYRTWWAYLFYILTTILGLWLFGQWRSQQLRQKNLALEALVDQRTEEIRHKNKQLGYQTERLKELDTMKTRLFANISHEFRTPLTLIKGPIEKLEQARENKISTPNIKMIRRNANRLLNLVNQLLDLSKLDSGKLKLNEAEGDLMKCLRAASSAFSSHAASRQMDYQIKIPSRLLWASFDRDKLEKILYNLLSNAFKFTPDEGRVIIETDFRASRLRLKVTDTGSGIAGDKLPHIFDRFFQVDDSYTKEKAGSGIGLALTKELVELMGGTIYVESELGKGTAFRVVIPMEEIRSRAIEVDEEPLVDFIEEDRYEPSVRSTEENEIKILIIEDNNDMRHFIREQLEADYDILEAHNGIEGLKMANKRVPDLIITDLMMPQMDGITLCKKLKTDIQTSHIPVIMLTAKAGIENKLEGLETGADDYLTKPFNARELSVRTKNLIGQRQQLRELFSKNLSLDPKEITVTSLDEDFLKSLLKLFEENYSDSTFGVPQMQKMLGMSKTSLHSKVKALTNHPPGELLRNFRLKRATQLLMQKGDNISQVAYDVGFNSLSYFTRCFKEHFDISPSEFIKKGANGR